MAAFLNDVLQKAVLLPEQGVMAAELDRLVKRIADALISGGDEDRIEPQPLGGGVGNHIAQNHAVTLFFQGKQRFLHFLLAVNGTDLYLILEEIAQQAGAAGDGGKTDDGVARREILRHLDGPEDIID